MPFRLSLFASFLLLWLLPAHAQYKDQTPAGEAPGPWIFGTIGVGKNEDKTPKTTALKGLAIKVGAHQEAAVCYDLDLCRMAGAWTGGKFTTPMNLMSRGEYLTAMGEVAFTTKEVAGFQISDAAEPWKDPRSEPFGPLPAVRYKGMYAHGDRVILKWDVEGVEVLESPTFDLHSLDPQTAQNLFCRNFRVAPSKQVLRIAIGETPANDALRSADEKGDGRFLCATLEAPGRRVSAQCTYLPPEAKLTSIGGVTYLQIPPHNVPWTFGIFIVVDPAEPVPFRANPILLQEEFEPLLKGGPAHWPETVETQGELAKTADKDAYVVDTIKLPDPNPWGAPMFLGGFDFFSDGRAAVCTFHGDVFIVSGLDGDLQHVKWRRFATGLYHALGLKIVNDEVYVTGRDGITRLRDLNGDGEADFYEAFNFDVKVTKSFHEFVFDLQTDPAGNFYFAKAGPVKNGGRGFDEICEHHGALFRVSPDGKKLEVVATGFRAPNGIGVGPNGEMTTGDNEGTWTPVCRLNWVKDQGFYGVVPLAHRKNEPPTNYDRPLCWLPKRVDNSSGGQVWVTSRQWGPWQGELLHLSYGTCSLFGVLKETVHVAGAPECCDSIVQGGVTAFPLKFQSGIMRARFSPADGQLYVAGLRGWQTTGLKNGAFQRVRYTGQPVRMPIGLAARKGGVEVKFTTSLNTQEAADPENWSVEVWNYVWSSAYGSPEISTLAPAVAPGEQGKEGEGQFSKAQMSKPQHDPLTVKSVSIGTDDRTVFLDIPDLKPVMQMSIKYRIKSADGQEMKGEIVNTINALGE